MALQTSCVVPVLCLVVVGSVLYLSCLQMSDSIRWTAVVRIIHIGGNPDQSDPQRTTPGPESRHRTQTTVPLTPIPVLHRANYSRLPQWDFEDVYNVDDSFTKTTCQQSLWKAVENDPDFKKAFIPDIQLFLQNDSISMREWNRLSHFNNPFGFMEYQYEELMPTIKLIPKPTEPLTVRKAGGDGCVRCAVVATGGILSGSKMGKEIDAHDYVFRMNGAAIHGFEEDVGNRTSVYVHTAHSITTSLYLFKKFGYKAAPHDPGIKYVLIPEGKRDFNWMNGLFKGERIVSGSYKNSRPRTYYSGQYDESRFYVLHQDFLRYVRNRFLKSNNLKGRYWPIVRPTNGAFTLFLALHTCDIVDAYGFITENHRDFSNYYAERNVHTHVVFYINHDYNLEKNTWKKLHDSKIIKLYQRSNRQTAAENAPQP